MKDKRGTKRSCSPSKEGGPSPSDTKTPQSAPSGSPPPPGSPSEVSSRLPCSPVFEQGSSFGKAPVMDLSSSSDDEGLITDVSWDEEFTRRLFGDFNRDVLGPSGDGKIVILSDSDEEEEVREEKTTGTEDADVFMIMAALSQVTVLGNPLSLSTKRWLPLADDAASLRALSPIV
jgi:hypothetical protein